MLTEILIRFAVGGIIVSLFAVLGDLVKPKSFAGIFGAAPSVALATIFLTVAKQGRVYMSVEARSMILGAVAFLLYACVVMRILRRGMWPVLPVTGSALLIWAAAAFGLWLGIFR
jgi:NhaP-type Na+/H+ and K+/H+ antiporter